MSDGAALTAAIAVVAILSFIPIPITCMVCKKKGKTYITQGGFPFYQQCTKCQVEHYNPYH